MLSSSASLLPHRESPFALLREMAEAPGIIAAHDWAQMTDWRTAANMAPALLIAAEGSSRIFPAKNLATLALNHALSLRICIQGAREAAENPMIDQALVIGLSNSGSTRELIDFCTTLREHGRSLCGITATPDSALSRLSAPCHVLSCGRESAVAATKSVIEQALALQSLLGPAAFAGQAEAAAYADTLLAAPLPPGMAEALAAADTVYIAGRNNGVAEEIALKTTEILRAKSIFLEGTTILHGVEETMTARDAILLVDPFAADMPAYETYLAKGTGAKVLAIAEHETSFPTLQVKRSQNFSGYHQLIAGWRLLAAAGLLRGHDLDRPSRARKVGNPIEGAT